MPTYIARRLNGRQQPLKPTYLHCTDDDDALQQTALLAHAGVVELYQGERRVWRFEARGRGADGGRGAAP